MSAQPLVVIGGGEHARVVIEAARSRPDLWDVTGFVDPAPAAETALRLGLPRLGDDDWVVSGSSSPWLVLGVGAVGISGRRERIVTRYAARATKWATIVHAAAWVSPTAVLEAGAVVMAGAMVNSGARIGAHAVVNTGAVVEHDVVVGAFAQLGPGAAVGGGTTIGSAAYLGLGCRVRDHVRVGSQALIGMGAVVVADVAAGAVVVGVPAQRVPAGARDE
ncbi:MAG TPA: NeuD/PglB/VioB family sugar acetyltransferase [Vicinamibacteria bacterium]